MKCRVCGENTARRKKTVWKYREIFGNSVAYSFTVDKCSSCKETYMNDSHTPAMRKAQILARRNAQTKMLTWIKKNGKRLDYMGSYFNIERCLGMLDTPNSIIEGWEKKKDLTKAEFALLCIIRAVPTVVPYMMSLWRNTMRREPREYKMVLLRKDGSDPLEHNKKGTRTSPHPALKDTDS